MLTTMHLRNFKRFEDVDIELGNPVLFVGPNDAGKTSALQALMLWDLGLRRWSEKRGGRTAPERRPGVTINRRDLTGVPAPTARLLWRDLHVRDTTRDADGRQRTDNVRIDIRLDGVTDGVGWSCGLEFDYTSEESFVCRPLRTGDRADAPRMAVPEQALGVRVAFLAPMSGLVANEPRLEIGAINVRIGEGRTAEVLRNLCHQVLELEDGAARWAVLSERIRALFGVELSAPRLIAERGEIEMSYTSRGTELDLSSSGRGMQQTLLLLSFLALNPGAVVLLDEPDAHLEILRQQQTYQVLSAASAEQGSQIIVASHSAVLLNEAAGRDVVVAFVRAPHRIDDRGSQVLKALQEIGFEQYYQAEITGFVLYLEGSTDLAILQAFAARLGHRAAQALERPFTHYVADQPSKARAHFRGLREAKPDLVAYAQFDRVERDLWIDAELVERMWPRREVENYLCQPETLVRFAEDCAVSELDGPLFESAAHDRCRAAMEESIRDRVPPAALRDPSDRFWIDVKASDELLDPIFAAYYTRLQLPNLMRKTDYHRLANFVEPDAISPDVTAALDALVEVHERAAPREH